MNSQQKKRWEMMLSHTCTFTLITCSDKADIYRLLGTNKSLGNWQKSGTKEIFLLVTNIAAKHRDEKTPNGLLFLFIDWTKCPTFSNLPLPFSVCLFFLSLQQSGAAGEGEGRDAENEIRRKMKECCRQNN